MKKILILFIFELPILLFAQSSKKLHFKAVLVDTHNDVLSSSVLEGKDISHRLTTGHSDLDRWKYNFFRCGQIELPETRKGFSKTRTRKLIHWK